MRIFLLAAVFIACGETAAAKPTPSRPAMAVETEVDPAQVAAATAAYGEWLVRLSEVQESIQADFSALQGHWQALWIAGPSRGAPQFRRELAAALGRVDAGIIRMERMPLPEVSGLELGEDLQPATMVSQMVAVVRELRSVMAEFEPLLEAALRNDTAAAELAARRVFRGLGQAIDSQIVTARASLEITPRELSDWELAQMELLYLRSVARLFAAMTHAIERTPDRTLARDLVELASQFDRNVEAGRAKLSGELEEMTFERDDLPAEEDPAVRLVMNRSIAALRISGRNFDVGSRIAEAMRASAEAYREGNVPLASLTAQFRQIQEFRSEFASVAAAAASALTGTE